jgi:hypothetical protein
MAAKIKKLLNWKVAFNNTLWEKWKGQMPVIYNSEAE